MSLRVKASKVELDIAVLYLSGSLTIGPETDALEPHVRNLIGQGDKKIIFELSGVERIDSVGGVALVRCFFAAREAGGVLRLACPSPNVQRLFKGIQVENVIPLYSTVAAACQDFTTG
jgi:anti-sigma B factor antagonist